MSLIDPFDLQALVLELQDEIGQLKTNEMKTYEVLAKLIVYLQADLGRHNVEDLLSELNSYRIINDE